MYSATLLVHSWIRWAVLIIAAIAAARAWAGRVRRRPWTAADDRAGLWFVSALDLQFLTGLLLYFLLSPLTRVALRDFGHAMKDDTLRFWSVEHAFGMLAALILVHVARIRIRKTTDDKRRYRVAVVVYTLALVAIILSIPWPGLPYGRPLLRW